MVAAALRRGSKRLAPLISASRSAATVSGSSLISEVAAYTQIQKYPEATRDCHKSMSIDPSYNKDYSRLGMVYYAQGNYREALRLDPSRESIKENMRVAKQKLIEEMYRTAQNQVLTPGCA